MAIARSGSYVCSMENENTRDKSHSNAELARTGRDPRISETRSPSRSSDPTRQGVDTTIGPSEVPENATLPPAEPVVPGTGRAPK